MKHTTDSAKWLSELLAGVMHVSALQDVRVTGVSEYSADVEPGDIYIAFGEFSYCIEAINKGAVAIVCSPDLVVNIKPGEYNVPIIRCNDLHESLDKIIFRLYGDVTQRIDTIAVTGTDGKSSVAHLVAQALEKTGRRCGLIGTLGYGRLQNLSEATHTTPPRSRLAKEYNQFEYDDCGVVALEASSHAIHQNRLRHISIHTAVLTNITRDHLDYHKTIEAYTQAKAALFFDHQAKHAVINLDDETGRLWCDQLTGSMDVISYSLTNPKADVYATYIDYQSSSICLRLSVRGDEIEVHSTLLGEFNVLNLLCVASVLVSMHATNDQIIFALNNLDPVPGRMQCVNSGQDFNVVVDYAHTPAALLAALVAVRKHCHGKVICVFGCGGDRDQGKRPEMGEIATQHSDFVILTSDNPRNESPRAIIENIQEGCKKTQNHTSIIDRRCAIEYALEMARQSDTVLIAGRGHEKYQYINGKRINFSDVEVVKSELQRIGYA